MDVKIKVRTEAKDKPVRIEEKEDGKVNPVEDDDSPMISITRNHDDDIYTPCAISTHQYGEIEEHSGGEFSGPKPRIYLILKLRMMAKEKEWR